MKFIEEYIKNEGAITDNPCVKINYHKEAYDTFSYNYRFYEPNSPIETKHRRFNTSIFAHAPAKIVVDVKDFSKVSFYPGVIYFDNILETSLLRDFQFKVFGDEEEIYCSPIIRADSESPYVLLDIEKYDEITFIIDYLGKNNGLGNTFLGELTFYTEDGQEINASMPTNNNFFSFKYNGVSSNELLKIWDRTFKVSPCGDITKYVTEYTDPETKFTCITEIKKYKDFPNYWWSIKFANRGDRKSYILSEVKSIDYELLATFGCGVNHSLGSNFSPLDFQSVTEPIKDKIHIANTGGRSSESAFPYFRVENDNSGYLIAMGWTGQWYCDFTETQKGLKCEGGIETFDSILYPGEEIKMPSINIMAYEGSIEKAHNIWREFIRRFNSPGGNGFRVPVSFTGYGAMDTNRHIKAIDFIADNNMGCDLYWIEGNWYGEPEGACMTGWDTGWEEQRGNWYENPAAHPQGFGPIIDEIHKKGIKFNLWFELQSARPNTDWAKKYENWYIKKIVKDGKIIDAVDWRFNIADDEACDFLIDYLDNKIEAWKMDWYREDFNTNPLPYWQYMDTLDSERVGMTEVKSVNNFWRFWDTIQEKNPTLIIDNCASGGRRLDIEMIGRGVSLWQSDYQCYHKIDNMGVQSQNMSLHWWLPYHTGGKVPTDDKYGFRSCMSTGMVLDYILYNWQTFDELEGSVDFVKRMIEEFREIEDAFYGDYFVHSFAGIDNKGWNVYEMVKDDKGFVMAFRGDKSICSEISINLKGVDPLSDIEIKDMDRGDVFVQKGGDVLKIKSENVRDSRLICYKKI